MFSVVHAGSLRLSVDRLRLSVDRLQLSVDRLRLSVDRLRLSVDRLRLSVDSLRLRSGRRTLFIFDCRCSGRARDGGIRFRGFLAGRAWLRTRVPRLRFIHVHAGGIRLSVDRLSVSRKTLLRFINVHAGSLLLSVAMTRRFRVARRALAPEPSSASAESRRSANRWCQCVLSP
jgi:hypothetical protein